MARRARRVARPSLEQLRRRIDDGWPPGLTLVLGEDAYHRDVLWNALLGGLLPDGPQGFAASAFHDDRIDVGDLVAAAREVGMFADRRVVVVPDLAGIHGSPEALDAYAESAPRGSYLLLRGAKLDQRLKLHKALVRAAGDRMYAFDLPDPASLGAEVRRMGTDRRLKLTPPAAALLAEASSGDLYRVVSELDKLRAWSGGRGTATIDEDAVREIASAGGTMTGWEVAEALFRRDLPGALAAVRRLVRAGDEPIKIVGGIAWRARTLLKARALVAGGESSDQALRAAGVYGARQEAYAAALRRWRVDELLVFPGRLLAADRSLKSRRLSGEAVLENLVQSLAGPSAGVAGRGERR